MKKIAEINSQTEPSRTRLVLIYQDDRCIHFYFLIVIFNILKMLLGYHIEKSKKSNPCSVFRHVRLALSKSVNFYLLSSSCIIINFILVAHNCLIRQRKYALIWPMVQTPFYMGYLLSIIAAKYFISIPKSVYIMYVIFVQLFALSDRIFTFASNECQYLFSHLFSV